MKILVIEESAELSSNIKNVLSPLGEVVQSFDGEKGMRHAFEQAYDMIVLDATLPKLMGDEVLRRIRQEKITPVIMLSSNGSSDRTIELLSYGADDVMVKPIDTAELKARILAVLRRYDKSFQQLRYSYNGLVVDYVSCMVTINGERVPIVGKMYEMLALLVKNKEIIVTKQQVFDNVCGFYSETIQSVVEVYACKLRKLLGEYGFKDNIRTIKTIGYMWTEKVEHK